jgi:hypothetical protein
VLTRTCLRGFYRIPSDNGSRNIRRYPRLSHRTPSYSGLVVTQMCLRDFCLAHIDREPRFTVDMSSRLPFHSERQWILTRFWQVHVFLVELRVTVNQISLLTGPLSSVILRNYSCYIHMSSVALLVTVNKISLLTGPRIFRWTPSKSEKKPQDWQVQIHPSDSGQRALFIRPHLFLWTWVTMKKLNLDRPTYLPLDSDIQWTTAIRSPLGSESSLLFTLHNFL